MSTTVRGERGAAASRGFTLVEVILALTVMSLVIMVLYQAFAMATRVWSRQRDQGDQMAREQRLNTLLRDDFAHLSPYTFNSDKGRGFFFAGGPAAVFYVTTNGFGAREHRRGGLYFACAYLAAADGDTREFYLYKSPIPNLQLLDALEEFRQLSPETRAAYQLPAKLKEESLLIVSGLRQGAFSYDGEKFIPPVDAAEEGDEGLPADYVLNEDSWNEPSLPEYVLFSYRVGEQARQLLIHLTLPMPVRKWGRKP